MTMQPFRVLTALAAPLDIAKIDTGVIFPGRFVRARRLPGGPGYAEAFLHDLRFDAEGRPRPDFVLNRPAYRNPGILVTGPDFGCGSSREGAACAVLDFGVRALVGASFGDVFVGNCLQNGVVVAVLPLPVVQQLWAELEAAPGATMTVDLLVQEVTSPAGARHPFTLDATRRQRLLEGLDDVGVTLSHLQAIERYEHEQALALPWRAARIGGGRE